ncbi:MAG TPA: hypothetical protein VHK88_08940 [Aquihabitans sp.]|jgi:hypothetical protein|nr:hypothetical protein [Aquihabitans sp.]
MDLLDHVDQSLDLAAPLRPMLEARRAADALDALADHIAGCHSGLIPVVRAVDRVRHDDADAAALGCSTTIAEVLLLPTSTISPDSSSDRVEHRRAALDST